jgi:ABC-2 type transport system permease protein
MATTAAARPGSAMRVLFYTELKLYLREKIGPVWGFGFPLVLLIIFGSIPAMNKPQKSLGGYTTLDTYIAVIIVFSLAFVSMLALPGALAGYREKGVLRRLKTTPVGPVRAAGGLHRRGAADRHRDDEHWPVHRRLRAYRAVRADDRERSAFTR